MKTSMVSAYHVPYFFFAKMHASYSSSEIRPLNDSNSKPPKYRMRWSFAGKEDLTCEFSVALNSRQTLEEVLI